MSPQVEEKIRMTQDPQSNHSPPPVKKQVKDKMSDAAEIVNDVAVNRWLSMAQSFVAGGVGGVCAVLVGHPFDLIKVRLQTSAKGTYSNAFDCLKKTVAKDGARGVYRGVAAPLAGVTPMFAISFWGYDMGKQIVSLATNTKEPSKMTIGQISAAGFISAVPTTAVAAPFERVKVLLQIQGQTGEQKYSGALDVVKKLYLEGGLRSVFKGSLATVARDGPGSAAYFATYEYLKRRLTPPGQDMSIGAVSFAGGMAGMVMWTVVFPVDTIKSRLQTMEGNANFSAVTKQIYRAGGIKAFFPGIGPALARSFPANAATFLGVELTYEFFRTLGK